MGGFALQKFRRYPGEVAMTPFAIAWCVYMIVGVVVIYFALIEEILSFWTVPVWVIGMLPILASIGENYG